MSEAQEKTVKLLDSKLDAAVIKTVTTCAIVMIVAVLIHDGDHIRQALNWGYSIPLSLWVLNLTVYVLPVVTLFLAKSGRPSATLMGAVFGALGKYISYDLQVRSMLLTVSGLLVVLIGLRMWGVPFLRRISPELTKPCRFRGKAFAVGLLTGLMPCGALSSMWIFAASSGSWASGAVSMLAFGAGTCVFMLLFGLLGTFLPKRYNKYLLKGSTILIVALGLSLMTKGIRLLA